MPPSTAIDGPPEFDVGDRVVTTGRVGPAWRRVPQGNAGVAVARTAERLIAVPFHSVRVKHVHPAGLAFEEPADGDCAGYVVTPP